ncbi:hypothetical protein R5R35_005318 [Gryllus longicercus]|uniref:Uncharacterized protein n=1 Tax=Gryllus longicercus TaxID=2509291 RepID=A0AAN9VAX1_9ORTH
MVFHWFYPAKTSFERPVREWGRGGERLPSSPVRRSVFAARAAAGCSSRGRRSCNSSFAVPAPPPPRAPHARRFPPARGDLTRGGSSAFRRGLQVQEEAAASGRAEFILFSR